MWKTFIHDGQLYMLKIVHLELLNFYITDLQNIWFQALSKESILTNFQQCNPLFDVKLEEAVKQIFNLVEEITENQEISLVKNGDFLELNIKSVKSDFAIQFKFNFTKSTSDVFLKEVTVPLVQTVKHLEARQNMLCTLIKKKDRELEEHNLEKGQISREDLITEKFDESKLDHIDDKSMLNTFGKSATFWEAFTKKYGYIEEKIDDVKEKPWNHLKRKRKVYSAKTATKNGKGVNYNT